MEIPDDAPAPRLCQVIKWADFDGYGFNLHAERNRTGQFIGKVDDDSPAELAGLRFGDRIVEVNNVNIANENHKQVVTRIKAVPNETKLLVVDEETDKWYRDNNIVIKGSMKNVIHLSTPVPRPGSEQPVSSSPVPSSIRVDEESGESVRNLDEDIKNLEIETAHDVQTVITTTTTTENETISSDPLPPPPPPSADPEKPPTPEPEPQLPPPPESESEEPQPPPSSISISVTEEMNNFKNEDDEMKRLAANNNKVNTDDEVNFNKMNGMEDGGPDEIVQTVPIIEDEIKLNESPKAATPSSSERNSLRDSPISNRSSEHRETPPTTPATPEPVVEPEPVRRNGHINNSQSNGRNALNLNMSAQEMRQMLSQRKKHDVRKDNMDMRAKYDMIQKM